MRSLRVRLALISMLVSGLAIAGLGLLSWQLMMHAVRDSTDVRLEGIAGRLIREINPWADEKSTSALFDGLHREDLAAGLIVLSARDFFDEERIIGSAGWSDRIEAALPTDFPVADPDPVLRPEPRRGGPRGGPERPGPGEPAPDSFDPGDFPPPPDPPEGPGGGPPDPPHGNRVIEYADARINGAKWRFVSVQERGFGILAGMNVAKANPGLSQLRQGLLLGAPIAVLLVGIGGWIVASRAMRPLRVLSATAERVSAEALDARMPEDPHSDPEIARLTAVLNAMMNRLEVAFAHANRFSGDVSHELKTPITVMQAEIETAQRECEPGSREEAALGVLRGELSRLKSIIGSLLMLSRADVGNLIQRHEVFSLSEELEALAEDAAILSEQASVRFESGIEPGLSVAGDAVLLRQALLNLLNNAIKFNCEGGFVRMNAARSHDRIVISVENSGPGIAEEDRGRIFDRFYRADRSRSREVDGFGLGLSLAKGIVEGHGGSLVLAASNGETTCFVASLPAAGS